jgi:hypothetical protein
MHLPPDDRTFQPQSKAFKLDFDRQVEAVRVLLTSLAQTAL